MRRPLLLLGIFLTVRCHELDFSSLTRRVQELREIKQHVSSLNPLLLDELRPHRLLALASVNGINVTDECATDMNLLISSAAALFTQIEQKALGADVNITFTDFDKNVLLPALDASGKPGPGILRGHLVFGGQLAECLGIDYTPQGRDRKYKLDYNRIHINLDLNTNGVCGAQLISIDMCLPKACTSYELREIVKSIHVPKLNGTPVCNLLGINDALVKGDAGTWIVYSLMGVIFALCALSGFVDYFVTPLVKGAPFTKGLGWKLFMAFSFYRNIADIFSVGSTKKSGQIGPVHCIRFFSLCWVIFGHMLLLFMYYAVNPLDVLEITFDTTTGVLTNAYFSVDSFFFLSGLLLGFIWFKEFNKNSRRAMSGQSWVMFYVHRILRLSPPYYILIVFWTFVFQTWLKNMPAFLGREADTYCRKHWWIDFLYLNNYISPKEQCYPVSWYLATDMQIFLFSPILLVALAMSPIAGLVVAGVLLTLSTAANIVQVYHFYFPPTLTLIGYSDPRTNPLDYPMYMYDSPYIRCQIYIMGVLVGYLLQNVKKMRINHFLNIVMWMLSFALMACVVLGLHNWTSDHDLPMFWRAMYSAFSKPAWGIALSWIVISCYYGYGGPINTFMSWNIWIPLGRLSYCAYLTHICVVDFVIGLNEGDLYWSSFSDTVANYVLPVIGLTYFFSAIWSAAFEVSLGKVEMLLIGGLRGPGPVADGPLAKQPDAQPVPIITGTAFVENADQEKIRL